MSFDPTDFAAGSQPLIEDLSGAVWAPVLSQECTFGPDSFHDAMMNLVKNPNNTSSWLFRADILFDSEEPVDGQDPSGEAQPILAQFRDFELKRTLVRRLIPRNPRRDDPLDQTCLFYEGASEKQIRSLILYLPHSATADELPFYHPRVRGVAHLHEWDFTSNKGVISVHYWLFNESDFQITKLVRTARVLLSILHKHGQGAAAGYVKRVNHDVLIPQARFQDRYSQFKLKYASNFVKTWAENTDPLKHVFEDLGIAAFLIELWADMYKDGPFPGFVDIGCGNGLLVHILQQEGFAGWGFDARARKSWATYNQPFEGQDSLRKLVLLPSVVSRPENSEDLINEGDIQDGLFPKGTFIISNHADELTPWTPILAAISDCPFISIPCCSHSLTGAKYRAPPPRDKSKGSSTYASLVEWVSHIAEDSGWEVETEMLRIPSTRNTALIGRRRTGIAADVDIEEIIRKYGGTAGYFENVAKLMTIAPRGH